MSYESWHYQEMTEDSEFEMEHHSDWDRLYQPEIEREYEEYYKRKRSDECRDRMSGLYQQFYNSNKQDNNLSPAELIQYSINYAIQNSKEICQLK